MSSGVWVVERPKATEQAVKPKPATYTLRQVGELLGLSYEVVWAHAKSGQLPEPIQQSAIRFGGKGRRRWVFPRSVVDQALGITEC